MNPIAAFAIGFVLGVIALAAICALVAGAMSEKDAPRREDEAMIEPGELSEK